MRKNVLRWLCVMVFCCALFRPLQVNAVNALETERPCSLTLHYTQDGTGFSELDIRVYRVAEAFADGTFELVSPFSDYPVNIHGITSQKEWKDVATTLTAYIAADQVQPDRTETTDSDGTAAFAGLETGLYLVCGVVVENGTGTYQFDDFMVYLPTPRDDTFEYDVEAKPKCTSFVPKTEYQVIKLWKDAGDSGARPVSITIDILKDGVLRETVVLSADNDWSYAWTASAGDEGKWTVAERDVPQGYQVTISENTTTFTITNTSTPEQDGPPDTGDSLVLWPWVLACCISGSLLLILSIYRERKQ